MENLRHIALLCLFPVVVSQNVGLNFHECSNPVKKEGLKQVQNDRPVWYFGETVDFTCNVGYTLEGLSQIMCMKNGLWDPPVPNCVKVSCPVPALAHMESIVAKSYNAGHILKLSCEPGYALQYNNQVVSSMDITCNTIGQWITPNGPNIFPSCLKAKYLGCPLPPAVEHASSFLPQNVIGAKTQVDHGTQAMYICDKPYQMVGTGKLQCTNGQWQGDTPQCKTMDSCPLPEAVTYGFIDVFGHKEGGTHYESGDKIFYICQDGYRLIGSEHRVCQDGKWIGNTPTCIPLGCPSPEDIPYGGYNLYGHNDTSGLWVAEGAQVYYYCHNGYKLSKDLASTKRVCQNGQWLGDIPTCMKRTHCDMPQEIPNGNYVIEELHPDTSNYGIGTRILYECEVGYLAYGAVSINCTSSGYWSDYPPKCIAQDQYCPHPGVVENGNFVCPDGCGMYKVGTKIHYICDDNYEPLGLVKQTCLNGGKWSAEKPSCTPVQMSAISSSMIEIKPTTVVIATSCSVLGLLLIVMVIVALQRHKKPSSRLCSPLGQPPPPPYTRPRTEGMEELDRVALIAFADGVQVTLPSYDEAVRGRLGSRYISEVTGMRHPSAGEYRPLPNIPVSLRNVADHHRNSIITTASTTTRDNLSLAFGSMDTMNVSDGTSTTITVDTLDSAASNPSLALSQRAVAGSIASSNGSVNNVNEEAPLLEPHTNEVVPVESPAEEQKLE